MIDEFCGTGVLADTGPTCITDTIDGWLAQTNYSGAVPLTYDLGLAAFITPDSGSHGIIWNTSYPASSAQSIEATVTNFGIMQPGEAANSNDYINLELRRTTTQVLGDGLTIEFHRYYDAMDPETWEWEVAYTDPVTSVSTVLASSSPHWLVWPYGSSFTFRFEEYLGTFTAYVNGVVLCTGSTGVMTSLPGTVGIYMDGSDTLLHSTYGPRVIGASIQINCDYTPLSLAGPYIEYDTRQWDGSVSQQVVTNLTPGSSVTTTPGTLSARGALSNLGSAGSDYDLFVLETTDDLGAPPFTRLIARSWAQTTVIVGVDGVKSVDFYSDCGGLPNAAGFVYVVGVDPGTVSGIATIGHENRARLLWDPTGSTYFDADVELSGTSSFGTYIDPNDATNHDKYAGYFDGSPIAVASASAAVWIMYVDTAGDVADVWRNGVSVKASAEYYEDFSQVVSYALAVGGYNVQMLTSTWQKLGYVGQWNGGYAAALYRGAPTVGDIAILTAAYATVGHTAEAAVPSLPTTSAGVFVYKNAEYRRDNWEDFYYRGNQGTYGSAILAESVANATPFPLTTNWTALGGAPTSAPLVFVVELGGATSAAIGFEFARFTVAGMNFTITNTDIFIEQSSGATWFRQLHDGSGLGTLIPGHRWMLSYNPATNVVQVWKNGVDQSASLTGSGTISDQLTAVASPVVNITMYVGDKALYRPMTEFIKGAAFYRGVADATADAAWNTFFG